MTPPRTAVVAGGGIAGPALAHWLARYGWDVTVVERAPRRRTTGQNVDVRGVGAEVLRRTGLLDAVRARRTGEVGLAFVDHRGRTAARFPADGSAVDGATAELEVLRGDLSELLVELAGERAEFRYDERVAAVEERPDGVAVQLAGGEELRADVVVAADGLGSTTRDALGLAAAVTRLGLETSYVTVPRTAADDDWWRWHLPGGGRSVHLRPDPHGTLRATLNVLTTAGEEPAPRRDRAAQVAHLREVFGDVGWHTPRVLAALDDAEDLYAEHLGQVRDARWWRGRTALAGDAAHCASPLSGMGTTLALTGGYVLAHALAAHERPEDAFRAYQQRLQPLVTRAQALPPGGPRTANPRSTAGVVAFCAAARVLSSRPLRRLGDRLASPAADGLELPDHDALVVR